MVNLGMAPNFRLVSLVEVGTPLPCLKGPTNPQIPFQEGPHGLEVYSQADYMGWGPGFFGRPRILGQTPPLVSSNKGWR